MVLAWLIPLLYDMRRAYKADRERRELFFPAVQELIGEASGKNLDAVELRALLRTFDMTYQPRGFAGLSRTLFAFALLTAIGVVLIALLALGVSENQEIVKSIVAALLGAFTTIVGVYYGARVSQESAAGGPGMIGGGGETGDATGGTGGTSGANGKHTTPDDTGGSGSTTGTPDPQKTGGGGGAGPLERYTAPVEPAPEPAGGAAT